MSETIKTLLAVALGGISVFAIIFVYFIIKTDVVSAERMRGQDSKIVCEWAILMDNNIIAGIECTW